MKISYWIAQVIVFVLVLVSQHTVAHNMNNQFWVGQLVLSETVQLDVALEYTATSDAFKAKFHSVTQSSFDIKISKVSRFPFVKPYRPQEQEGFWLT